MSQSLKPRKAAKAPENPGCVDFVADCATLQGWLACGWIAAEWQDGDTAPRCTLSFDDRSVEGEGMICLFPRSDVAGFGAGFVLFLPVGDTGGSRNLLDLTLEAAGQRFVLRAGVDAESLPEREALARGRVQLAAAAPSDQRKRLLAALNRPAFTGTDTLAELNTPIYLEFDVAVFCPPGGIFLRGWFADPFGLVAGLTLRGGPRAARIDMAALIRLPRADLAGAYPGLDPGLFLNAGFMTFIADAASPGHALHVEIETSQGDVAFKRLPPLSGPGLAAIKDVLSYFDFRHAEMEAAYNGVIGPAIAALNAARLPAQAPHRVLQFGVPPAHPACSLIVPLYGRIDFLEYQLAFFSRDFRDAPDLIYVLDDPRAAGAAMALATSCLARFGLPFRLIVNGLNLGFGPASNIGLRYAASPTVCFLNSDVFPQRPDWLSRMLATLHADTRRGVVGALLLYEDDTVQHAGCSFAELPEFAGWTFCLHPGKGLAAPLEGGVIQAEAVTGACMMMRTEQARALGGFDEGFVIGDFEDIDLCRRAQAQGLTCVVDLDARLYHLERQSQGGQHHSWRLNLTLYNAWLFRQKTLIAAASGNARRAAAA
jgi:GT2 family glycosyltransferase